MRALVTGATGFIGSHLVERLLGRGHYVRVLARAETQARQTRRVRSVLARRGVEVVTGSLTDSGVLAEATCGADVVYHLAWQSNRPSVRSRPESDRQELVRANVEGTEALVRASATGGARRFVYTSTVAVYGEAPQVVWEPLREEDVVDDRPNAMGALRRNYIEPKLDVERLIERLSRDAGLEFVVLRPSIVYGPGAPFAADLVHAAVEGDGDGRGRQSVLQLVHVDDVVEALLLASSQPGAENRAFTIAGQELVTKGQLDSLIRRAARVAGNSSEGSSVERWLRLENLAPLRYDLTRAKALLKYRPRVPIERGVVEMVYGVLEDAEQDGDTAPAKRPREGDAGGGRADGGRSGGGGSPTVDLLDDYYDRMLSADVLGDFYEHSDYWNFGYRVEGTETQLEACERLMEELLALIPQKKGTILDVACGKGATTRHLARYFPPADITGINISDNQLERCRANVPEATFLKMDAAHLEFEDESFDTVICVEAATHFDTREGFFREARRVLKPGGRLVLSDAILSPRSRGQPSENYVRSADEYRLSCLRAGFAAAEVIDVTEPCWDAFRDALMEYMRGSLWTGEVSWRVFRGVMGWLTQASTELYVLAWCEKEP